MSGIGKQARYLTDKQIKNAIARTEETTHAARNKAIIQLGYLAGLRAKEIALLRWEHLLDSAGQVGDEIVLTNDITKGKSGGRIPLNDKLRQTLLKLRSGEAGAGKSGKSVVIRSERGGSMKAQSIVNLLWQHYRLCDIEGASSHSGRRTFITNAARKISQAGGSIRDVQALARHSSLQTTQLYVEQNSEAQKAVIKML